MAGGTLSRRRLVACTLLVLAFCARSKSLAADWNVSSRAALQAALNAAQSGDRIRLAPSVDYGGGFFAEGLTGVTIASANPLVPAVLDGAGRYDEILHLTSASNVTIENVALRNYLANGLNIDDGGNWPVAKSQNIRLSNLEVSNAVAPDGNFDAIKLSGVDQVLVDRVRVSNWGTSGSAIDPVGVHHALVQNSIFTHPTLEATGSGIRPKGGSEDIQVYGNLLTLSAGRALAAGGSTDSEFFRFLPGSANFEAKNVDFAANLVVGADSAVNWINSVGGTAFSNLIDRPREWIVRLLNENPQSPLVETQGGSFESNYVRYRNTLDSIANIGPDVLAETFTFARNQWFNVNTHGPASEVELGLPVAETAGRYGVDPLVDPGLDPAGAVSFPTTWGRWIVNPHTSADSVAIDLSMGYELAQPQAGASFNPLEADPFVGDWLFTPLTASTLSIDAQSQALLALPSLAHGGLVGDANGDGQVGAADYALWAAQFGRSGVGLSADFDKSSNVGAGDYALWASNFGNSFGGAALVPEPPVWQLALAPLGMLLARALRRLQRVRNG